MIRLTGKDFIDVERVALATVLSLQSSGVLSTEVDAPETD
jgi:hypothetical protein